MVNLAPISARRPLIVTVLGLIAMLGACVYYEPSTFTKVGPRRVRRRAFTSFEGTEAESRSMG